ncbi:MAG: DUF6291 domain-containing protein [Spirochaetes bacterium]|nr:DUF6291 domain-containing protein [Brevinematales bacterium]MCL1958817.1 DUF6291 domain-containing protein [Spirochaetota bacterium]
MPTNSFVFYRSFSDVLKKFSPEDFKTTIIALTDYALDDKETKLSGAPETAMMFMKPLMDNNRIKRSNGRKGGKRSGEARRSKMKQKEASESNSEKLRNNGNEDEEISCDSNEPPDEETSSKHKSKELTLQERKPVNDMERVEKAYLQNWDTLYSQNKVKTPDPVINWGQTRSLLKTHLITRSPEIIIQAINDGMKDKFVMSGGYALGTILAAPVLNRLINAASDPPDGANNKKTLSGLESTF